MPIPSTDDGSLGQPDAASATAAQADQGGAPDLSEDRPTMAALLLDNIGLWAFVTLAITALYCVWATLEIVSHWVETMPGVTP